MDQIDREIVQQVSEAGILDISWVMDRIAVGGWIETEEKMRAVVRAGITHVIDMAWEHDDTPLERRQQGSVRLLGQNRVLQRRAYQVFE